MRFPTKLMMASTLALFIAAPVHAQSPNYWAQQGDYYANSPDAKNCESGTKAKNPAGRLLQFAPL
jgi:hypothetical protein